MSPGGEISNNDYAKFVGVKETYYGICASREWHLVLFKVHTNRGY